MKKLLCLLGAILVLGSVAWGQGNGTISGTVMTELNGIMIPLPFVHVMAFPVNSDHPSADAYTDSAGSYTLNVAFGEYHVKASAFMLVSEWYDNVYHRSEATVVAVSDGNNPSNINFVLAREEREGGRISGRIFEEGTDHGIAMATVTATRQGGEPLVLTTLSMWNGLYSFFHVPAGAYVVDAVKDGWSHGFFPETLVVDNNEINDINIALVHNEPPPSSGSISGMITNSTNSEPIGGAHVTAMRRDYPWHHWDVNSQDDGTYRIENVPAGTYSVNAFKEGFMPGHYPDPVHVDSVEVTGINIALTPFEPPPPPPSNGSIAGTVTDSATGLPIGGAMVFAINVNHHDMHFGARTHEDGTYLILVRPGEYRVEASAEGYWRQQFPRNIVVADSAAVEGIDFALVAIDFGSIAGMVTDTTGAPVANARIEAKSIRGRFGRHGMTDSTGAYLIEHVIPGMYRVRAFHRGFAPGSYPDTVVVGDGQNVTDIDIVLGIMLPPFNGIISGTVTDDSTAAPIANAFVMAVGENRDGGRHRWAFRYTFTADNGTYSFNDLPSIPFKVFAASRGYFGEFYDNVRHFSDATPVTPNADGINFALTARSEGPRTVAGRIIVPFGYSADGMVIYATTGGQIADITLADPDGYYSLDDVVTGSYEISVSSVFGDGQLPNPIEVVFADVPDANIELSPTSLDDNSQVLPRETSLNQNYPNPFNARTMISFNLSNPGNIELSVFNVVGQKVTTLVQGEYQAGNYNVVWDGRDMAGNIVSSGIYYYRLKIGDDSQTMKMTLLK